MFFSKKQVLDTLIDLDIEIRDVIPIDEGVSSYTYKIVGKNQNYYLSTLTETYKDNPLSPRALLLEKIAEYNIKVPIPIANKDFDPKLDNFSWSLVTEIAGRDLREYKEAPSSILVEAGRDLARLHNIKHEGFGYTRKLKDNYIPVGDTDSYYKHLTYNLRNPGEFREKVGLIVDYGYADKNLMDKAEAFIEKNKGLVEIKQGVLMHGDFAKEHIFSYKGAYTGIIDWDGLCVGSGIYDLVQFELLNSKTEFDNLLEGYFSISILNKDKDFKQRFFLERLLFVIPKLARISQARMKKQRYTSEERELKFVNALKEMLQQI